MPKPAVAPRPRSQDELAKRLQTVMQQEAAQLAAWSGERQQPHTLAEIEQAVLAAVRRLAPQLMEGLLDEEAAPTAVSPPVRVRAGDEGSQRAAQAPGDAGG
jgi:hypothetical protein